jgi:ubiquinone/menaquinone biosynthesis C-methylase UbiE
MERRGFKNGWMSVDTDEDPRFFVRLMDMVRGGNEDDPAQYRAVFDALDILDGERVLEVRCGTGGGVRALVKRFPRVGSVVGVDVSQTMIEEARRRTAVGSDASLEFQVADAHRLPFPDNSFDAVYSLRVFEIIADPLRALEEMARVLRHGGRLLVNCPDIDTWAIDSSDREVTRRILHHACDFETNGWVGRQMFGWCKKLGLIDVDPAPVGVVLNEFTPLYEVSMRVFVARAKAAGAISSEEAAAWVADLTERDRRGEFFCSYILFRLFARKP